MRKFLLAIALLSSGAANAADSTYGALPAAAALAGTEPWAIEQSGASVKVTPANLRTYISTFPTTVAGTTNSGGIPYFSSATALSSSAVLAANALMVGGGAGAAPSTVTTGTNVLTALGVNVGSAGAFTPNNYANVFTKAQTFQPDSDAQAGTFRRNSGAQTSNVVEIQTEANGFLAGFDKSGILTLGAAGTQTGTLKFTGTTSGVVTLSTADAAGTWTMKLPTSAGTNNYVLATDGSGNTSWVAQTGGGGTPGGSSGQIQYNSSSSFAGSLLWQGTDTIEQYNSTTAQSFFVHNTRTDASNYERGAFKWATNVLTIGSEKAGTGSNRAVQFQMGGTSIFNINTSGHLLWNTDNTYDIGASGATRPRDFYTGRNAIIGNYVNVSGTAIDSAVSTITGTGVGLVISTVDASTQAAAAWVSYGNNSSGTAHNFFKNRVASASSAPTTAVQQNDILGGFNFLGASGTTYERAGRIRMAVDGSTISTTSMPGRIEFLTSASSSVTPVVRAIINKDGLFVLGASQANTVPALKPSSTTLQARLGDDSADAPLTAAAITSSATVKTAGYTVAGLPAGTVGMRAYVTDQTTSCPAAGAALTGGGAVTCPVFYNGSAWVGD